MQKDEMMAKVVEIFRDVFDDEDLAVERSSNSETIEDWDSLAHINLVVAIEKALGIKFTLAELQGLKDVGETIDLANDKRNA